MVWVRKMGLGGGGDRIGRWFWAGRRDWLEAEYDREMVLDTKTGLFDGLLRL